MHNKVKKQKYSNRQADIGMTILSHQIMSSLQQLKWHSYSTQQTKCHSYSTQQTAAKTDMCRLVSQMLKISATDIFISFRQHISTCPWGNSNGCFTSVSTSLSSVNYMSINTYQVFSNKIQSSLCFNCYLIK